VIDAEISKVLTYEIKRSHPGLTKSSLRKLLQTLNVRVPFILPISRA